VKKWNGGDMVQRWAVAALLRAEKKFKRVKGYREIPKLIAALQQKILTERRLQLNILARESFLLQQKEGTTSGNIVASTKKGVV
jgi:hypothetical protein